MLVKRQRAMMCAIVAVAIVLVAVWSSVPTPYLAADALREEGEFHWYRGNLHTHTMWSDGDDFPEMVGLWYRDHGYDFLCFTDHNTTQVVDPRVDRWVTIENYGESGKRAVEKLKSAFPSDWVEEKTEEGKLKIRLKQFQEISKQVSQPGKYLLIQGEEITDRFNNQIPVHLNATNLSRPIYPHNGHSVAELIQENVDSVVQRRQKTKTPILIHLCHPNFGWGVTAEDMMKIRGLNFFEVYNGHPDVHNDGDPNHASTERIWDIVNAFRTTDLGMPLMYALATDDGHKYHKIPSRDSEPGRGWIAVHSDSLTPEAIIGNMEKGRFYASTGVTLDAVIATEKGISVEVKQDPVAKYRIEFIGTLKGFDTSSESYRDKEGADIRATRRYSDDIGKVLKTVEGRQGSYEFQGNELYVRARITSTRRHPNPSKIGESERAWTQPVRPKTIQ